MKKPYFFTKLTWTSILVLSFVLQLLAFEVSGNANASGFLTSQIKVDSLKLNGCYVWTDQIQLHNNSGIPVPPAFIGMNAERVECSLRHHFQVISIESQRAFSLGKKKFGSNFKYCWEKFNKGKYVLPSLGNVSWSKIGSSKLNFSYSCFVISKNYLKPGSSKAYFFEELFSPLDKKVESSDR